MVTRALLPHGRRAGSLMSAMGERDEGERPKKRSMTHGAKHHVSAWVIDGKEAPERRRSRTKKAVTDVEEAFRGDPWRMKG
jgi:hypothetical protein